MRHEIDDVLAFSDQQKEKDDSRALAISSLENDDTVTEVEVNEIKERDGKVTAKQNKIKVEKKDD